MLVRCKILQQHRGIQFYQKVINNIQKNLVKMMD